MDEKLAHLDKNQIQDLMRRYYNENETATNLVEEYEIDITPSRLYTLFPDVICDEECRWCGEKLRMKALSKTALLSGYTRQEKICLKCGHIENTLYCRCENCENKRGLDRERKEKEEREMRFSLQRKIQKTYQYTGLEQKELSDLSFEDRVYLGAILRGFLSEDMTTINPVDLSNLSPNSDFSCEILRELFKKRIILVDGTSDITAFEMNDNFPDTFYLNRVIYRLNLKMPSDKAKFIRELLYPKETLDKEKEDMYKLWKKIAVEECIEYLLYQFNKVGFEFSPGKKTYALFEELLDDFSVSQIYAIIYPKVAYASKLYLERTLSRKQAANSVISACRTYGEKIKIEGWEFKGYSRIKDLPPSVVSEYFFNRIIEIGDKGFSMVPISILEDK